MVVDVEDYEYNALGALKKNAGVLLDHQRPRLDGGGLADAAVPATLGGQPVVLDSGGRITSLKGTTFNWSPRGFLKSVQEPGPVQPEIYGVDSELRRTMKMQGGIGEFYVFEGLDRVATVDSAGAVKDAYLFDGIDHPLRIRKGATTAYYELDLAFNVRRLRASGGADLGGYRYSAFGQTKITTTSASQPLQWKGRWASTVASGIYDVRARQWVPDGVFLSVDAFEFFDVHSPSWAWPGQSPSRFSDPSGNAPPGGIPFICAVWNFFNIGHPLCEPPRPRPPPPAAVPYRGPDQTEAYCNRLALDALDECMAICPPPPLEICIHRAETVRDICRAKHGLPPGPK